MLTVSNFPGPLVAVAAVVAIGNQQCIPEAQLEIGLPGLAADERIRAIAL